MADRRSMLSSSSSKEQKREEGSDDTAAMEMKHNKTRAPDNRLLTDQAKPIDIEQLVISTNMAAPNRSYLPPDIVEEILDLLPSTSINRFRSVSKSLFSLLAIKFNVPKLLYHPYRIPSSSMYGIKSSDDQGLFIGVALSDYSGDVNNRGYMAPELSGPNRYYSSVGSCNGLVCLQATNHCFTWETFVWNPFTNICRKLPELPFTGVNPLSDWRSAIAYGFGYVSASDDYKAIVATGRGGDGPKVEIFSLKTGSWKKMENSDEYFQYIEHLQRFKSIEDTQYLEERHMGLFLNGALHWGWANSLRSAQKNNEIIAFDLDKERFYHVPSPPNQICPGSGSYYSVGVVGEYLSLLFQESRTNIVWVMKEYCNEASWVPFISYTSCAYVWDGGRVEFVCNFIPQSFKDGRYLMLQFSQGGIHVLKWNNNLDDSDEAEKYSKKIELYTISGDKALPYTETVTSPYAS
ncbi:hypothetical protein Tsubulata_006849 [Turnera subulata]|uniref:F-box domain-containing protein n=1 Tax=Turnera subulata TaxID=218843 RepID=A0A9Q0JLR5_9ROSI|nr:hypothetical protein Tsubulata_006849 [Turnera subulata]